MGANTSQEIDNNQYPAKKMIRYPQITSNSRPSTQKPILKKSWQKVESINLLGLLVIFSFLHALIFYYSTINQRRSRLITIRRY